MEEKSNNHFSLLDLYPKYVINSKGEKKSFDEMNIAKTLNKETGLDINVSNEVAEDVIRTIIGLDLSEITTNYIRELVCVELTQRGLNKYRNLFARAINLENISFKLDEAFIDKFRGKQPNWGPLGYITYKRTYARIIETENRKEEFWETVRRVVEGCYSIQKEHCMKLSLPWIEDKAQRSAQTMYQKIWNFKMSPPGRGLWMMGTEFIARHGSMALNNCGFASTSDIDLKYSKAFEFVMDTLMLGVGVGFDTKGAGKLIIKRPKEGKIEFQIPDSREGWVEALQLLLEAYFLGKHVPTYDFNKIRLAGDPIRGFGGIASGPEPLKQMLLDIQKILEAKIDKPLDSIDIVDIMNHIGKCVVAGNVRRCIAEDQRVATSNGEIKISDIKIGDLVLTSSGLYKKILKTYDQGIQEILKITTTIGELECTGNHRVAVYDKLKSYKWKFAKDLTPEDRLISIPHTKGTNSISTDYAWLIGFYIGDGNARYNEQGGGTVSFAMAKNHVEGLLGKKCIKILKKLGFTPSIDIRDNSAHINVYRVKLVDELQKYKKPNQEQTLPEFIWKGTINLRAAFLAGLADADGDTRNDILYSKYPSFLKKVQKILLSMGIASTLHLQSKRKSSQTGKYYEGSHSLKIRGLQSQKRTQDLIIPYTTRWKVELKKQKKNGLSIPYKIIIDAKNRGDINFNINASGLIRSSKTDKVGEISTLNEYGTLVQKTVPKYRDANFDTLIEKDLVNPNWMPIEIISMEPAGIKQTYDIEVEDNQEFVCEGFLVHNSAEIALGDPLDEEFILCKQDKEKLYSHRWASNNSVFATKGMDYSFIADQIKVNGEPGIFWLDNARAYSRMGDDPDYKDNKVAGVNPCITGDTLIAVADGRNAVPIKKLAEEGLDVPVYCKDDKGITLIKMMRNPRITGYNEKIYEVNLDDGNSIKCTGNHQFLMKDGTLKPAIDLKPFDRVMITPKWQTTWSEIMGEDKKKKSPYWILNNGRRNIFEHTLVYEQLNKTKVKPGYIIHHRDLNSLNNNISNLEVLLKDKHDSLHDISGDKNPMRYWYPHASLKEKGQYHDKMSEATAGERNPRYSGFTNKELYEEMLSFIRKTGIPLTTSSWVKYSRKCGFIHNFNKFRGKLVNLIKRANIECGFEHYKDPALMREYKRYCKLLESSDFELVFDEGIWLVKQCELCGTEFRVKYRERERSYCSYACSNKVSALKAGAAMKKIGKNQREIARKKLFELFEDYVCDNNEIPTLSEFLEYLKANGINDFRTAGIYRGYQYVIDLITEKYTNKKIIPRSLHKQAYRKEMATELISNGLCSNHKIVSVVLIGNKDVYNGTVDEFHNFGIILNEKKTKTHRPKLEMIFTANCGEQSLESFELCCLVENFPSRHDSYEEFQETLKYAYLYAKSVTLVNTHWKETNAVMLKNRRMGISQTGIIEAFTKHGRRTILNWCDRAYKYLRKLDEQYSDWLCVPRSVKITTVKPSGTVSLLPGVPPGIHYPHSEYYIRRIRISKNSDLIEPLRMAGYKIEDDAYSDNSFVVEFPVHEKFFDRSKFDVSIWEQAANAAAYQKYWSDNQVSITITFKEQEADEIKRVLESFEDQLKSVSFLPLKTHGYKQAPYEKITKDQYQQMVSKLKPLDLDETRDRAIGVKFCDADGKCEVELTLPNK